MPGPPHRSPPLSPPRPGTPPLKALQAFEAAARHENFHRAAEELSVTPGAIAQQVRKLEDWAGQPLFERHPRGVTLTPHARRVLARLGDGFDTLARAAQMLRQGADRTTIRIAALPAIAQLWLSPKLSQIRTVLGDAELSIAALDTCPVPGRDGFDLALYPADRLGHVACRHVVLMQDHLVPVAAPEVARRIRSLDDLRSETLIHDAAWKRDWRVWLDAAGGGAIDAEPGPAHSLYSIAVERCAAGDGVLIGHSALIAEALARQMLVEVFPEQKIPGPEICLVLPPDGPVGEDGTDLGGLAAAVDAIRGAV